ncbi:class IV adenylate cyclase [Candidatus Woesearchaeota archaeon]|nr:class IV adenylate cyclase [Candidatus Woesearchaeota archaeon]
MNHEIEVKLKYEDKNAIVTKLHELGAKSEEKYRLDDIYFSQEHTDMSNAHDLIRIRTKRDKSELTFKGKCETDDKIWKRVELSTGVDDADSLLKIFKYLKFHEISKNKSIRELWKLGNVEVMFVDFIEPHSLKFIEIEGPSKEKVQKVIDKFGDLVTEVGEESFKKFDETRKG